MGEVVVIDVSKWQGVMNWEVAKPLIHACIIKAGEGVGYPDPQFANNWDGAKKAGIPRSAYFYFKPEKDGSKQLEFFLSLFPGGYDGEWIPWLDMEYRSPLTSKNQLLNSFEKFVTKWWSATGKPIGVYTRTSWWDPNFPPGASDIPKQCPLWLAQYGVATPTTIPREWQLAGKTWDLHQYSADGNMKGKLYGAQSNSIDLDTARTLSEFNSKFGLNCQPFPSPVLPPETFIVTAGGWANLRSTPEVTNTNDIGDLIKGTKFTSSGPKQGEWIPITGWVNETTVKRV